MPATKNKSDSFTHLHVHTEYSLLDGASRLEELVDAAVKDNQPALGITDHGNMYGVVEFYKACKARDIKPVLGTEAYMAHEHRSERPQRSSKKVDDTGGDVGKGEKLYYHLTLLAENNTGYKNLIQVASRAFMEGYYYKPRVDWEVLNDHAEGLIATSGCLGSHVNQALMKDDVKLAGELAGRLAEIFGKDSFFIEMQDHGIPAQKKNNQHLLDISKKLDIPLLATNDTHYTHAEDADAHDVLLCVQTGSYKSSEDRFKFSSEEHYLKTASEMRQLFADIPEACDNTLLIAERADVTIELGEPQLPDFPVPKKYGSIDEYLKDLTFKGAAKRWGKKMSDDITERLTYELKVISDMGFSAYFLIVRDLVIYAKENGIRVGPGRGSAAGSAVSYCLEITDLDPIEYDLLFERFLNPGRTQMPDIDLDFDSRGREQLISYLSQKYGKDKVAQIITLSRIKARQAIKDAARVMEYPYKLGDQIAKSVPGLILGRNTPLAACLKKTEGFEAGYERAGDLREIYKNDPDAKLVIDAALGLEGLVRQDSIHAAAVVLTRDPMTSYLPLQRKPSGADDEGNSPVVTQYEMGTVEELGLLKLDLLGLRNLDIITEALKLINRTADKEVAIETIPLDDEPTYELLQRGDTTGVFQLESEPMRALMRSLRPTGFDDIAALVALYRPGPMEANMHTDYADRKNGRKEWKHLHEDAEEILDDTYGLMIYQESMMRIAQKFAGYSLEEAENLRKACGKKVREIMRQEKEKFVSGCQETGYTKKVGEMWWKIIEPFADYAFNKSHSYSYGLIAYQTAWLKTHYPAEFSAAVLTSHKSDPKLRYYLSDCRQRNIKVALPDINEAELDFNVLTGADGNKFISFGLGGIRNIGPAYAGALLAERNENGPYSSLSEFLGRLPRECLTKGNVERLIKAGCLDRFGYQKEGLLAACADLVSSASGRKDNVDQGMVSMFGEEEIVEEITVEEVDADPDLMLQYEKDMLGVYLSQHPLDRYASVMDRISDSSIKELGSLEGGTVRTVCGVLSGVKSKPTKGGKMMLTGVLEDYENHIDIVAFDAVQKEFGEFLENDVVVRITGRVDTSRDTPQFIIQEANGMEGVDMDALAISKPSKSASEVRVVSCSEKQISKGLLDDLKKELKPKSGAVEVRLDFGGSETLSLGAFDYTDQAEKMLVDKFGEDSIRTSG